MRGPPQDNVVLVGMRACGKTTLGRALAARLQLSFVDLDEELGRRLGRDAEQVLAQQGEPVFRRHEAEVLRWAAGLRGFVIATGGGAVLHEEEFRGLAERSFVVYLELPAERLIERASARPRTALSAAPLEQEVSALLAQRESLYRRAAHLTLTADGPEPILALVEGLLRWQADERG